MSDDLIKLARDDDMSLGEFDEIADKLCRDMADSIEKLQAEMRELRADKEAAEAKLAKAVGGMQGARQAMFEGRDADAFRMLDVALAELGEGDDG